jgi:ABC-type transport system involved in cytochrome bd biosynthesis fused ATPase/permease subunit
MRGRTSFVIAHRLSTIAGADMIVVIENGRITQTGTHAELMAEGGKYRTMVEQQIHMTLGNIAAGSLANGRQNGEPTFDYT